MKRFVWVLLLVGCVVPAVAAQDHAEIGAYGDYFRLQQTRTNFAGLGARVGINTGQILSWEAEMSYDFGQVFGETYSNGTTTTGFVNNSNLAVLHGLFGPKISTPRGPVRVFLTVKGGFMDLRFSQSPASFSGFTSSVEGLRANNVDGVLYPGVGIEGHIGPIGLRLDAGDEIYFNGGAQNNLRISFGPIIRF